jgi:hypothetical protein
MYESEVEINTDWINNETRLLNEEGLLCQEAMKTIKILHVYMNETSEIIKIKETIHTFMDESNVVTCNEILRYYIENRKLQTIRYKLFKVLVYNVDLGDKLYQKMKSISTINCLKSVSLYKEDIVINPSLFIFHEMNSIYLIYKENRKDSKSTTQKIKKLNSSK